MSAKKERKITSGDDDVCVVCFKEITIRSIMDCEHTICFECSTRLRVLCDKLECPICRQETTMVSKQIMNLFLVPIVMLSSDKANKFWNSGLLCLFRRRGTVIWQSPITRCPTFFSGSCSQPAAAGGVCSTLRINKLTFEGTVGAGCHEHGAVTSKKGYLWLRYLPCVLVMYQTLHMVSG